LGFVVARNSDAAKARDATTEANAYGAGDASGSELSAVSAIPADGGVVVDKVVLIREGEQVRAFSAVCTHQGCLVDKVTTQAIECPCHGSRFDATTGRVLAGPASAPLAKVAVTVRDGKVFSG
jgi:Rieske Fe-S protein